MKDWADEAYIRLWDALSGIYGKRLTTEHGETMPDVWRAALAQISYDQAKYGLDLCLRSGDEFVPTLPQFMYRSRSMPKQPYKALPSPTINQGEQRERIKAAMAGMKSSGGRRSIYRPGESPLDVERAFYSSGLKKADFDQQRLALNGWSDEDEAGYARLAHAVGYRL